MSKKRVSDLLNFSSGEGNPFKKVKEEQSCNNNNVDEAWKVILQDLLLQMD